MRSTTEPMIKAARSAVTTRITEAYARLVARDAYFWAWPMVNVFNRRLAFREAGQISMPVDLGGVSRWSACPTEDMVHGAGVAMLDNGPVVVQVPEFGTRFWIYQVVNLRTDSCADIGVMHHTRPGFYLLAGPRWNGRVPNDITQVFVATTNTVLVMPSVWQDDTSEDEQALQAVLSGINMYPLAAYDGKMKRRAPRRLDTFASVDDSGPGEWRWVCPERFFDQLPQVLLDAPPLAGERPRYAEVLAVMAAARSDARIRQAMIDEGVDTERTLIEPLLEFRNFGIPLAHHWTTHNNGAQFGTDYFIRTAVARSNLFVTKAAEIKYFYQDLDASGARLNGGTRYAMTFAPSALPPVHGFWSLTLYDRYHFFTSNAIKRYSIGTGTKNLTANPDGSLTIYVQATAPANASQRSNWLPAPRGKDFSLCLRAYWPDSLILEGRWTPPGVEVRR